MAKDRSGPLRDRSLSNEPTPEDADGIGFQTTPLRVPKRDTPNRMHPSQLSRRASNTINRLKSSSLVSQSPFRTQIPTSSRPTSLTASPAPRRVSGEKRPRPNSMHSQAENEKPLGFKRRQSKGLQGLIEKEPVSKSPFRKAVEDNSPPAPPPKPSRLPTPSSSGSPVRPSLVSKRFHGPRTLGHEPARRQRRKTVTFDPNCDVLEFDRDDYMDEEPFFSDDEVEIYDNQHGGYIFSDDEDDSYEDHEPVQSDSDQMQGHGESITGLVDSILHDTRPHTPPHDSLLPPDAETEDGVPYGRTHHAERAAVQHAQLQTPPDTSSDGAQPFPGPITPVVGRRSLRDGMHATHDDSDREAEDDDTEMPPSPSPSRPPKTHLYSLAREPTSKPKADESHPAPLSEDTESADPFSNDDVQVVELSFMSNSDIQEELDRSTHSITHSELSFGALEAELGLAPGRRSDPHTPTSTPPLRPRNSDSLRRELPAPPQSQSASPLAPAAAIRATSPSNSQTGSPAASAPFRITSLFNETERAKSPSYDESASISLSASSPPMGSLSRRSPRIRMEDVQRRLLRKRSTESPVPEPGTSTATLADSRPSFDQAEQAHDDDAGNMTIDMDLDDPPPQRPLGLRREDNHTYDGVLSIDPEEQPIDPPRPNVLARAASANDTDEVTTTSFRGIQFDISEGSGLDLGISGMDFSGRVEIGEVKSALDKLVENVATNSPGNRPFARGHARVESVTEGVPAQPLAAVISSTDILQDSDEEDVQPDDTQSSPSALLHGDGFRTMPVSRSTSSASIPPPPPPKDAIRNRELAILEKRREMRRVEEDEAMGRTTPPRRTKRRSMSAGEAVAKPLMRPMGPDRGESLDDVVRQGDDADLEDVISRELHKRDSGRNYHVREHETIYASADADRVAHMRSTGDLNSNKAWRAVRRPSDMNEYAEQIREYRAQEKPGKGHGKVFVRVVGVRALKVPIPQQPTVLTCTLNNGIHFVTTPECPLVSDCRIDQEFELIEHSKLEFTLTLKIRRDPHIMAQFKSNVPPPPAPAPPAAPPPPASKGGMRSFFSSSPKKPTKIVAAQPHPPPVHRLEENLARYLKPDGTLARAFVSFKEIGTRCDARLFETAFPLIGQHLETGNKVSSTQVGELMLQFFRLPPLPGIPNSQLPQSLDECHRGLRHVHWHKMTYFEGVLTQSGGDCTTWRRRQFRIIGANLVAFNDVTKRATASIDLRKALGVEDLQDPGVRLLSPSSSESLYDEYDFGIERSFRVTFKGEEEILFFADSDEEKARWLEVLRALVGRIPPNPLWAELLWQRQQEIGHLSGSNSAGSSGT